MGRRGKGQRGLSEAERELWARVAQTASPMHAVSPIFDPPPAPKPVPKRPEPSMPIIPVPLFVPKAAPRLTKDLAPSPAEQLGAQALRMDHKTHRKMTSGKLRPEARIDLHGMTLAQAHPELIRFILTSRGAGRRLVLVITGKGLGKRVDDTFATRPGALRHQVPHWLHQPPLSPLVMQVTPAHLRHGGTGAYYVYLRR